MNSASSSDLSLIQLLQQQSPTLKPMAMGWSALGQAVRGVLQFLGERRIEATLWVKLPPASVGDRAVDAYYQTGLADRIYRCHLAKPASVFPLSPPANLISLVLETSSQLKQEYFLLVLSPQICFLIFAQDRNESTATDFAADRLPLNAIATFSPSAITTFLDRIRQSLTITDNTPEELLSDSVMAFPLPTAIDADLASDLWQLHLQSLDSGSFPSPLLSPSGFVPTITLDAEFLKQLTRELSLPLTNMKTALRLLDSMQHKREQRQRYLSLLQKECDRQSLLLTGLQEMVEINQVSGENPTPVRLEDLIPGIVSTYQPLAAEKGIRLGYTVPAGLPSVACPSPSLRQVLRNLLHNSLKFTPASGRVYVQADRKDDLLEIIVSDTGVGIEHRDLPHIFEPFFRGRNFPPEEGEGVGLGLMVVKYLVEQCQGAIAVYSKPQKGTQIKLTLPISAI
jgi:two-component system phosphate regulon sensor histidine kinase PhoR